MASSPPTKKTKYDFDFEPGVMSGAKSASELAKGEDNDAAFTIDSAPLASFFPPPTVKDYESEDSAIYRAANSQTEDMSTGAMTFLRCALNEKTYRNGIYRQLTGKKYNLKTVPGTRARLSYEEMSLLGLFQAFVEENSETDKISGEEKKELSRLLRRKEHGLKITTTSLPDLSFLRYANDTCEFVLGEVKHASKYSWQNAQQQAACYLQALLYFLRVKIGLPVATVYGFALCGTKCSGLESSLVDPKYAVGFVKVSSPRTLDGRFEVQSYWEKFGAFDSTGLKLLIHFLKFGNSYEYGIGMDETNVWGVRRDLKRRCPSLFTLPVSLWEDTADRILVLNGTLAAVFQANQIGATQLLDMIVGMEVEGRQQGDIRKGRAVRESLNGLDFNAGMLYIKIHTTETMKRLVSSTFSDIWENLEEFQGRSSAISDFFQTYPVKPPTFSKCSFIVMYNRGESLRHVDLTECYKDFSTASPALLELKRHVEELREFCFHGDILPHNVAVDKEKLTLFDYDEALALGSNPPRRVVPEQANVYRRLSYPNILRRKYKREYAAVQFSLIVRSVAESLVCSASVSKYLEMLCSYHDDLAKKLNAELFDKDVPTEVLPQVQGLVKIVDSILSAEEPDADFILSVGEPNEVKSVD